LPYRDRADLGPRVAVTAAAVLVYHVGGTVPLPGLDPNFLASLAATGGGASERLSILALGIVPFFTALLIAELVKTIVPRRWLEAVGVDRAATGIPTISLAIVIAFFQASAIAAVLEDMNHAVAAPGVAFRLSTVLSLVAGAALMIWLADQVTRHGLGSGVWILLLFPVLLNLPYQIIAIYDLIERRGISLYEFAPMLLLFLGAVTAISAWCLTFGAVLPLDRAFLWPTVWAFAALPLCLVGVSYVQGLPDQPPPALLAAGQPLHLLLLGLLIVLFSLLSLRAALSQERASSQGAATAAALFATLTIVAVALVGELLDAQMPVPLPVSARDMLLVVIVALAILSPSQSRSSP
jgi:preprotein translocase subunit SecY